MNEKKPINVLAEYVCDWIHQNSGEAAPFDSFEVAIGKRIEQKDVERWIFDCNYLYYRFGDYLFNDVHFCSFSAHDARTQRVCDFLDRRFKTIKDSNPLNLRSKQEQAVVSEFLKDWPPFLKSSRNTIKKLERDLDDFKREFGDDGDKVERIADDFLAMMNDEADFYQGFARSSSRVEISMIGCCKEILPLWVVKEINPLYTLLIWEDEAAIAQLAELLKESFTRGGYPSTEGSYHCDSYVQSIKRSQAAYIDALMNTDDDDALASLSIPEIWHLLDAADFSLTSPCLSDDVPSWLYGKAQLIWNIVGCAIFGPKEVVDETYEEQTRTRPRQVLFDEGRNEEREGMQGEVILRRLYKDRGPEMVGRLIVDDVDSSRLWKVIGAFYDENAALPSSSFRPQYENLRGAFIATQGYDDTGHVTEGDGDSRYHAELSVRVGDDGRRWLVLRDLGSKNGTYVVRSRGEEGTLRYYVLRGEGYASLEDWVSAHGVDQAQAEIVDELVLLRGDLVHLCGSCFEVL